MEDALTYDEVLFSINALREHFKAANKMNVVRDKVILSHEGNTHSITFNMIMPDGKALPMEYEVNDIAYIPNTILSKQVLW